MISSNERSDAGKKNGRNGKQPQPPETEADFQFLAGSIFEKNRTAAYRKAYGIDEDHYDRNDCKRAAALREAFLSTEVGQVFMKGVQIGLGMNPTIADPEEVLGFLSATFRGEVKDQFGLDPALSDRIKAAEDMAKHHKLLTDSLEVKADSSFADALSKARRRAAKGERDAP